MTVSVAEVIRVVFATARADAGLTALVPADRIRSHIPELTPDDIPSDTVLPYIRIHPSNTSSWDDKTQLGFEMSLDCDVWSERHDDKDILLVADALVAAFQNSNRPSLSSGQWVYSRLTNIIIGVEPDGQTHHGVISFDIKVTSNA